MGKDISQTDKAIYLLQRALPQFVTDAVNLEGINYTFIEVKTLLDGVTVGGHKLSDQTITLNQKFAWDFLIASLKSGRFSLDKSYVCELHAIAAKEEALEWGVFRNCSVKISGTEYTPPSADKLDALWQSLNERVASENVFDYGVKVFLDIARNQYFFDANRRTGRFLMNGIFLQAGLPPLNVPYSKQSEFNEKMIAFYQSNDSSEMLDFMRNCIDPFHVEFLTATE